MDGAEKLALIGKALKAEADGKFKRRFAATLRAEAKPAAQKAADRAREVLPKEGGLNNLVADRHTTISVITGVRTAGVRLKRSRKDAASYQTNRGYIWHKTFGEKPWRRQELPDAAGWWDDTLAAQRPEIVPALLVVIDKTAREIGAI